MLSSKGQAFVAYPHRPMTLHRPTGNSLAVLNHKILEANSQVQNVKLGGHQTCLSINRLGHELCDMLRRLDEVEKLAYQLNEEAERTERPIRILSNVMYGSTRADMQVDVMGKCLSRIKHVVGTTSGCFCRGGRIIRKLEEGRSVTSVAAEFGIAHSIVSRLWRQFQTTGTAIRGSVVVVHEEPHPQMTGTCSYRPEETGGRQREKSLGHTTQATGRPISRFTVARRCTVMVCLHDALYGVYLLRLPIGEGVLCGAGNTGIGETMNGDEYSTDESRFSLSSDSHRILIWREQESRNHPSNIIERDRYGGRGVLVWGGIMLGSRTDLHIFDAVSVNRTRYCNEILLPYVRLFRGAMGLQFPFHGRQCTMSSHSSCRTALRERLAARTLPPVTIQELCASVLM
ncbi:transposable element Tcb2 transposase [Trichonephila clavipes]|nr:transposable element Tcb2 transposase [Trichonephila clavipes]